jgi:predicted RNA methylase
MARTTLDIENMSRYWRITQRVLAKSLASFQERGMVGTCRHLLFNFPEVLHNYVSGDPTDDPSGVEFDRLHNTDTGGRIELVHFNITTPNFAYGVRYHGTGPALAREMIERLAIEFEKFTFVDFGSGKGRVLLVASEFPFRKIVGVEFAPELCEIARNNIKRFQNSAQQCTDFEILCLDAVSYAIPETPAVLYFFNPFGREVMARVAESVCASLQRRPREVYVIYYNPVCASVWDETGFFQEIYSEAACRTYMSSLSARKDNVFLSRDGMKE